MKTTKRYDDIINLKYPFEKSHPPMSLYARSAQFAPFAALTRVRRSCQRNGSKHLRKS